MWKHENKRIQMDYGDYGIALPFTINKLDIKSSKDRIILTIKKAPNSHTILTKQYVNKLESLTDFAFDLVFTQDESKLLKRGSYNYYLTHVKPGVSENTIVSGETFKVE